MGVARADVLLLATLTSAQILLWWYFYDARSLMQRHIIKAINSDPDRKAKVVAHMSRDLKPYGITDPVVMVDYFALFNFAAPLHHGLAALFAILALDLRSVLLFRIALSFEIGEDLLHYIQMLLTLASPSNGVMPWAHLPKGLWFYIGLHHLIGSVGGSWAFLFASDWPEIQLYATATLVCLLAGFTKAPFQLKFHPLPRPSLGGKLFLASDVFCLLVMIYLRLIVCIPLGRGIAKRVLDEKGKIDGFIAGSILVVIAPTFFSVSILMFLPAVFTGFREQFFARKKEDPPEAVADEAATSSGIAELPNDSGS